MNYLSKMTVKELREVAERMGVYLQSKVKKDTIIFLIESRIENLHTEALDMNNTYTCQLCGEKVQILDQPEHMIAEHTTLHTDNPIVIDTEEFPMDHGQFTVWYDRHGGIDSFDVNNAMASDHAEALEMNTTTFIIPGTDVEITDPASIMVLEGHFKAVRRFNPTLKKDKSGMVILTPKQRRRVQKHDRKMAKKVELIK